MIGATTAITQDTRVQKKGWHICLKTQNYF